MKRTFLCIVVLCLFFVSCKKDSAIQEQIDYGYQYFPLKVGDSSFFQVENIFWNDFDQTIDTTDYLLCEYVESVTTNYAGDSLYRIERMIKSTEAAEKWQLDSIWFAIKNQREAIRVENNKSFVKMVFPLREKQSWNGNIYNVYGEKIYKCTALAPVDLNGIHYANAASIEQQNFETLINSDVETEVYAKDIGLVQMYRIHVYKEYNASSGEFKITSGYRYTQNRIP